MKNIDITMKASQIVLLQSLLRGCDVNKVQQFFQKKSHTSSKNQYREGSESYNKEVEKDLLIAELPDHNVKFVGSVTITASYSEKIRFSIGKLTHDKYITEYTYSDEGESVLSTVEEYFLVENSHWGYGLITSISELLGDYKYERLLLIQQLEDIKDEVNIQLDNMGNSFYLIRDIVVDALKEFKSVEYYNKYKQYNKCVVVDDVVYSEEELDSVVKDYKDNVRFYDKDDRVIEFNSWDNYLIYHRTNRPTEYTFN